MNGFHITMCLYGMLFIWVCSAIAGEPTLKETIVNMVENGKLKDLESMCTLESKLNTLLEMETKLNQTSNKESMNYAISYLSSAMAKYPNG